MDFVICVVAVKARRARFLGESPAATVDEDPRSAVSFSIESGTNTSLKAVCRIMQQSMECLHEQCTAAEAGTATALNSGDGGSDYSIGEAFIEEDPI